MATARLLAGVLLAGVLLAGVVLGGCSLEDPPRAVGSGLGRGPVRPLGFRLLVEGKALQPGARHYVDHGGAVEVTLAFGETMDRRSAEEVAGRLLPKGSAYLWTDDRTLTITVAPGGPFTVDVAGAISQDRGAMAGLGTWEIRRPEEREVNIYRAADLMAGQTAPLRTWTVRAWISGFRLGPDGETAVLYDGDSVHFGPAPHLVHLPTGKVTLLPNPNRGQRYAWIGWLPDGRLLMVGQQVWTVGSRERDVQIMGPGGGRTVRLSPSGQQLAQWDYAVGLRVLDLKSQHLTPAKERLRRGGAELSLSVGWSPDESLLAGTDYDPANPGEPRIRFINPVSGAQVRELAGYSLIAWLSDGRLLAWRPSRVVGAGPGEGETVLLDSADVPLNVWPGFSYPSPDGRFLLQVTVPEGEQSATLIDLQTGRRRALELPGFPHWTQQGEIMVVRDL